MKKELTIMTIQEALRREELFSDSEKEIANYILEQRENILNQSVQDIAAATYTSTSSVFRVCRKIGLDGFKDFKIKYAAELERRIEQMDDLDPDFPFMKSDTILDIAQKMNVLMINTINDSYDIMVKEAKHLQITARMILKARRIFLVGVGDSFLKGQVFQSNMLKIDKVVMMCGVFGDCTSLADVMTPQDCAIIVSYSGNTRATYDTVKILKSHNVPMIAITSDPDSLIGKSAQIILQMPQKEGSWDKQATFVSQTATEYYLNVLYSYIYVLDYDVNLKHRKQHINEFGDIRNSKGERNEP